MGMGGEYGGKYQNLSFWLIGTELTQLLPVTGRFQFCREFINTRMWPMEFTSWKLP